MYNFTPCYKYTVKTVLSGLVMKHASNYLFHNVCSEDMKPQNVEANLNSIVATMRRCSES